MSDFILDRDENPHPRMREVALHLRRTARTSDDVIVKASWLAYRDCMMDATGWDTATVEAWLDSHDDPDLATKIVTEHSESVPMPRRR